jgi:tetratricopeptide (TPR) repeat protein
VFMQKIRRATKKHSKLLIVIVVLLAIGLVGSFAVWGSDRGAYSGGDNISIAEQISQTEAYIAEYEPGQDQQIDFSTASSMASMYMQLLQFYYSGANEIAATDPAAANAYMDKLTVAATKAADYYQKQLELAPDTLNDFGRAQILAGKASALFYIDGMDEAKSLYEEALNLAPESLEIAVGYLSLIYNIDGLDAAQDYADQYMALVGEESESYQQMENQMLMIKYWDEIYKQSTAEGDNAEDSDADADADVGQDDGSNEE